MVAFHSSTLSACKCSTISRFEGQLVLPPISSGVFFPGSFLRLASLVGASVCLSVSISYTSCDGLMADMRQIVSNAEIFNGRDSMLAQVWVDMDASRSSLPWASARPVVVRETAEGGRLVAVGEDSWGGWRGYGDM